MKLRIGLMGGTFDPIHIGHLVAAEWAREAGGLDEVWFMPTYRPPHKSGRQGASPEQRRDMVELAICDHPHFRLETIELERGGVSYAVDTAQALTERCPGHSFVWIVGGDMVKYLPKWHRIEDIVRHVEFLGLTRPGFQVKEMELPAFLQQRVTLSDMPALDISSTEIRERCGIGRSVRYLVPESVRAFMEEKGLYTDAN